MIKMPDHQDFEDHDNEDDDDNEDLDSRIEKSLSNSFLSIISNNHNKSIRELEFTDIEETIFRPGADQGGESLPKDSIRPFKHSVMVF